MQATRRWTISHADSPAIANPARKRGIPSKEGWQALLESPYARDVKVPADAQLLLDGEMDEREYLLHAAEVDDLEHGEPNLTELGDVRTPADSAETDAPADTAAHAESAADGTDTPAGEPTATAGMQLAPTGLAASGRVTLSPPPNSSPYYDGSPRRIHGYIEVDVLRSATARSISRMRVSSCIAARTARKPASETTRAFASMF